MTIFHVHRDPESVDYLLVTIDGYPSKRWPAKLFEKEIQKTSFSGDAQQMYKQLGEIETKVALKQAIYLLSKKSCFSSELQGKLEEKELDAVAIENAVAYCMKAGYIDDDRKMEYLIAKAKDRGFGPFVIKAKLRKVLGEDKKLDTYIDACSSKQEEAIDKLLKTKLKKLLLTNPMERKKAINYLQRRGFDIEAILSAIRSRKQ